MAKVHIIPRKQDMRPSQMLDYYVAILKDGTFQEGRRYQGYSGNAVYDEIKFLSSKYPKEQGYSIKW